MAGETQGQSPDPSQDQEFLKSSFADQHAYLMDSDPEYAKSTPEDQQAYRADVLSRAAKAEPAASRNLTAQTAAAARTAGVSPTAARPKLPVPTPTGPLSRFVSGAAAEAAPKIPSLESLNPFTAENAKNIALGPSAIPFNLSRAAIDEYRKSRAQNQPVTSSAVSAVAAPLQFNTQGIRERAAQGDIAGLTGMAATDIALATLGPRAIEAAKAVPETAIGRTALRPITGALESIGVIKPEARKALTRAIQPGVNIPRAQESIPIAGSRLQQVKNAGLVADEEGNPITEYKSNKDLLSGVRAAKNYVWDNLEKRTGAVAELQTDTSGAADAMTNSISKRTREQYPDVAARIEARAETYRGLKSFRDIENAIQDANNDLRNFYKRSSPTDSPITAETAATEAEVKYLRNLLDDKVEKLTGAGTKELKREYGALRDVERAAAKQYAVETRQKGATLWEGLAALRAAGDFVSGNMLGAAKGAATMAMGERLKNVRSPAWNIDQAFQGPKAFKPSAEIALPSGVRVRGALPPAPMQMPPAPDRSGPVDLGKPTVLPMAENRQLPAAGQTTGPRTVMPPSQFGISLPAETPRPLTGPERQLPETASPANTSLPMERGGRGPNQTPPPFQMPPSGLPPEGAPKPPAATPAKVPIPEAPAPSGLFKGVKNKELLDGLKPSSGESGATRAMMRKELEARGVEAPSEEDVRKDDALDQQNFKAARATKMPPAPELPGGPPAPKALSPARQVQVGPSTMSPKEAVEAGGATFKGIQKNFGIRPDQALFQLPDGRSLQVDADGITPDKVTAKIEEAGKTGKVKPNAKIAGSTAVKAAREVMARTPETSRGTSTASNAPGSALPAALRADLEKQAGHPLSDEDAIALDRSNLERGMAGGIGKADESSAIREQHRQTLEQAGRPEMPPAPAIEARLGEKVANPRAAVNPKGQPTPFSEKAFNAARAPREQLDKFEPDTIEEAKAELTAAGDVWGTFERPGRYIHDENFEPGAVSNHRPETVVNSISSARPQVEAQFPWLKNLPKMTEGKLRAALASGKGVEYTRLLNEAGRHIQAAKVAAVPIIEEYKTRLESAAKDVDEIDPDLATTLRNVAAGKFSGISGLRKFIEGRLNEAEAASAFDKAIGKLSAEELSESTKEPNREGAEPRKENQQEIIPPAPIEGVIPGLEGAVRENQAAAGKFQGEELSKAMRAAGKNITEQTGEMETKSPLFRGTAASPQNEMFAPGGVAKETTTAEYDRQAHRDREAVKAHESVSPNKYATFQKQEESLPRSAKDRAAFWKRVLANLK